MPHADNMHTSFVLAHMATSKRAACCCCFRPAGQWTALGGPLSGTCIANTKGCNDVGNKCCIRTDADKAQVRACV